MSELNAIERGKFWTEVMERYEKSGLTRKEFCNQNNLSFSKFRNWRCRINRKHTLRDREAEPSRVDPGSRRIFFAAEQVKKIYEAA